MNRSTTSARLREIETKCAGVATAAQAEAAIRARLATARAAEREVITAYQLPDVLLAGLFFALCDRYGLTAGVASERADDSVTLQAPPSFVRDVFGPLFEQSSLALLEHLSAETDALIGEAYGLVTSGPAFKVKPPGA